MKILSEIFFKTDESKWIKVGEGLYRQMVGYDVNIMMVKVKFDKGAIGVEHDHHHSQTSYVVDGEFEVNIGGEKKLLKAGDGFFVPPNVRHGAVCLQAGMLIDVFSPLREEFLP